MSIENPKELVIAVPGSAAVYDFIREGEDPNVRLAEAKAYAKKYEIDYKALYLSATPEKSQYWLDCAECYAEAAEKYEIMPFVDFLQKQEDKYCNQPVELISEELFDEMLGVLPPWQWQHIDRLETFLMSELTTGPITYQYARNHVTGLCYRKYVNAYKRSTWMDSTMLTAS